MSELNFKGKEFVYNHHLTVPHRPLVPDTDKSIGAARLDGNLIIQGDNLHALKSLLPMYANKVDCIFIDPPYNTGNEGWCYNDNVNSPMMQAWLQANPVGIEDGLRHDKWCAMMWPRLRLLKELLRDDGLLFISIDDNEAARLRCLLSDIFGEESCLGPFIWKSRQNKDNRNVSGLSNDHEYIFVVGKQIAGEKRIEDAFDNPDDDLRGPWSSGNMVGLASSEERPNLHFDLIEPRTSINYGCPQRGWRYEKTTMARLMAENRILWPSLPSGRPREKAFLNEMSPSTNLSSIINLPIFTRNGTEVFEQIMGNRQFAFPKPPELIEFLIQQHPNKHAIVLDSFAGSGTTAHAVLAANKKDGGDRKFILVECEDYADKLTAERVRRVIKGYDFKGTQREELMRKSLNFTDLKRSDKLLDQISSIENLDAYRFDKIEKTVKNGELLVEGVKAISERTEGLGGSFTYCTLGEAIDIDRMLTGESLPSAEALGALLFHMATNEVKPVIKKAQSVGACSYLGESASFHVWLIYQPKLDFLTSREAALTLSLARALAAAKPAKPGENAKRHLVFAPAKFVSQKLLDEEKLPVEFAPLPWALYRVERS